MWGQTWDERDGKATLARCQPGFEALSEKLFFLLSLKLQILNLVNEGSFLTPHLSKKMYHPSDIRDPSF